MRSSRPGQLSGTRQPAPLPATGTVVSTASSLCPLGSEQTHTRDLAGRDVVLGQLLDLHRGHDRDNSEDEEQLEGDGSHRTQGDEQRYPGEAVSYTHLTLPTIYSV